jgi:hypothetical protein
MLMSVFPKVIVAWAFDDADQRERPAWIATAAAARISGSS